MRAVISNGCVLPTFESLICLLDDLVTQIAGAAGAMSNVKGTAVIQQTGTSRKGCKL